MKNEYLHLQSALKESLYRVSGDPIKWFENFKGFFDSYFQLRFENTKILGNDDTYNNFQIIYDLLLLDFAELKIEFEKDYLEHQIELLKLAKGIPLEEFNEIYNLTNDIYNKSLTYQIILLASFIFRFSNIESIQSRKFYNDFIETLRAFSKNANEKLDPITDKEKLRSKVKNAKSDLEKEGSKITLTNIAIKLNKKTSTLQSQLNIHQLKWRDI